MSLLESLSLRLMKGSRYQEDVNEAHQGIGHVPEEAELVANMQIRFDKRIKIAKDAWKQQIAIMIAQ